MSTEPNKPKYYALRVYGPMVFTPLALIPMFYIEDNVWRSLYVSSIILIAIACNAKFNPKEVARYQEHEIFLEREKSKSMEGESSVNENIEKYKELEKLRKQNAKWWQFWV